MFISSNFQAVLSFTCNIGEVTYYAPMLVFSQASFSNISLTSGRYYKHMTILNDDSGVVNKLGASLTDNARFVIYIHHMFIAQATETPFCRGQTF